MTKTTSKYKVAKQEVVDTLTGKKVIQKLNKYDKVSPKEYWIRFLFTFTFVFFVGNILYLNMTYALILAIVITLFSNNYIYMYQKKKKHQMLIHKQLNLYLNLMSQMVNANKNLLQAFKSVAPNLLEPVRSDMDKLIYEFEHDGTPYQALDRFSAKYKHDIYLKMFHDQLKLAFKEGNNGKILDEIVEEHTQYEISVDEFSRKKSYYRQYIYYFTLYVAFLPLPFLFIQKHYYTMYVQSPFGICVNTIIIACTMYVILQAEKLYLNDRIIEFM